MKIAIVILNWNGKALLEQFLPSVIEYSKNADIYVADNASTDGSVPFLKQQFSEVKIIQNSENGGYAKGYNDALKHINADVLCLLNNDVEVSQNWLNPIIDLYQNNPNTAIVQPKLLDYNRRDYFEYAGAAGGFIDKFGYPYCRGRIFNTIEKDNGQYNDVVDISWASGACFFVKNEVFKTLNGFDEAFFAHMEEIDFCWRVKNLGYDIKYIGSSVIYHVGGATLSNASTKKTFLNFRNSLYTLVKNGNGSLFYLIFIRLVLDALAGIKFALNFKPEHALAIVKSHFSFYKHLPTLLKQRKALAKSSNYYLKISIVWSYFIRNKKHFKRL